jgi:hypothetical protein
MEKRGLGRQGHFFCVWGGGGEGEAFRGAPPMVGKVTSFVNG